MRRRKTDVICTYCLLWDQFDSQTSFETFLSAPLAVCRFSFSITLSLRPLESFDSILFEHHILVIGEDETEHSEAGGRRRKVNEVATL